VTGTAPVTVALTDATGFTGGGFARAQVHRGYRVRALTRPPPIAYQDYVGVQWIHGETSDPAAHDTLVAGADTCFHIAAIYRDLADTPGDENAPVNPRDTYQQSKLLGYGPRVELEEGFRETVAWYRREGLLQ